MSGDHHYRPGDQHPFDGLGPRSVYLDNIRLECVLWCNQRLGEVCVTDSPAQLNDAKDGVRSRVLHGKVRVYPLPKE